MSSEFDESDLPKPFAEALRSAYGHRTEIPLRLDDAVLDAGRAKFDSRRRIRLIVRWGTGLAAGLAAVIVLAVTLHRPAAPAKAVVKGDVNADGQVNMVDALALAKRIDAKTKVEPGWDMNGDGRVDSADVQAVATAAVSLKQEGLAKRLPTMDELGIKRGVGLASASGIVDSRENVPLAKASPTKMPEDRQ